MPQRRRRVESRDFAITEIDFSNEMSDPDDRFDHAQHFWASTVESRSCSARKRGVVSKRAMNQLLRSLEKLGYVVGSDGLDRGPRDLSASPGVDMSSTRKFSTSSATSRRMGRRAWARALRGAQGAAVASVGEPVGSLAGVAAREVAR
jgi:hypothetical protein